MRILVLPMFALEGSGIFAKRGCPKFMGEGEDVAARRRRRRRARGSSYS